jgi:hypothetical protein
MFDLMTRLKQKNFLPSSLYFSSCFSVAAMLFPLCHKDEAAFHSFIWFGLREKANRKRKREKNIKWSLCYLKSSICEISHSDLFPLQQKMFRLGQKYFSFLTITHISIQTQLRFSFHWHSLQLINDTVRLRLNLQSLYTRTCT